MNLIFGISGSLNSGKSSAATLLANKYLVPAYSFSKLIETILINEGKEINRISLQDKGLEIIKNYGYSGIADLLLSTYTIGTSPCIIEGIRHIDVAKFYRERFKNKFVLIFIDCPIELRFSRIKGKTKHNIIVNTMEDFLRVESHVVETGINDLKLQADFIVNNSGSVEDFENKIADLIFSDATD